jgi:hypothetical protein
MNRKSWKSIVIVLIVAFTLSGAYAQEQRPAKKAKGSNQFAPLAASSVTGSGTPGQITKWTGVSGSNTYTIGDTNITEDKFGKIGIGTGAPTSLLTVQGMIETTLGGYKFPDGTVQTTAGIPFVIHDASLMGNGRSATPLGIALGGVQTVHLANGAVTAPKIANGTVVRSLNGLFDNLTLAPGANITITPTGNTLTIASPNSLTSVAHDSTLMGSGTSASPLGVAAGGIGNPQLADNAVTFSRIDDGAVGPAKLADNAVTSSKVANGAIGTAKLADNAVTFSKIATGQVVTSLNSLTDNVVLAAGSNITITPSGNTLTIATPTNSSIAYHAVSGISPLLNAPGLDVISKQVPAGTYIIFYRADVLNDDSDPQSISCTLSTGDTSLIRVAGGAGAADAALVLQDTATFSATTTITVHCQGFKFQTAKNVLTALKVDTIQ